MIPTAETVLENNLDIGILLTSRVHRTVILAMKEFAKLHVKAALEEIKKLKHEKFMCGETGYLTNEDLDTVYPEENIK